MAATRTIDLRTAIPGPRSQELLARKRAGDREREDDRAADRRARGSRRDADRRRRQRLHRLHGRRRLPQRRALAPACGRGRDRAADPLRAHRFHRRSVRAVHRARRAAAREGAVSRPRQGGVLQRRHRGGRERGQVRAALHGPAGGDRVRRRVPRPHAALADAHLEAVPLQARDGPARARGLPRAVPAGLPRAGRRDGARGAAQPLRHPGRERAGRSDRRRARPGRGRLPAGAAGVHGGPAGDLRRPGHLPRRRRGADRLRAHRASSSRSSTTGSSPT